MTKRRLAVTNRSAAFSSPACARRARRRSSSASVISGSFCMSWRYWSKAVVGEERKKPLDLLSPVVCISPMGQRHYLMTRLGGALPVLCRTRTLTRGAPNRQQPCFMPRSSLWIFGLRSGGGHQNGDPDHDDAPHDDPSRRYAQQNRSDGESNDEDDESDQVGAERRHEWSRVGFSSAK